MSVRKFSLQQRLNSIRFAWAGLRVFFQTQHNAWIHAMATIIAIVMGWLFKVIATEWLFIVVAIGLVWVAELFNTAIEILCDRLCPQIDPKIKLVKDISAAAVLVTALLALITAGIIFIPKILR